MTSEQTERQKWAVTQSEAPSTPSRVAPLLRILVLTGLSLSIGWGIRGNYGHEHGAMIAGALGAMAAVLLSGRQDWWRRIAYFGLFGAIGWAFGGSISYMHVIGYTHSGDSLSVFYGFAMLFLCGFLWGAIGGAGTAMPAFLTRERLTEFFLPGIVLFGVLIVQDLSYDSVNAWLASRLGRTFIASNAAFRQDEPLYWLDTSWTSYVLSMVALGVLALVRRRWDRASALIMHMCVGWWIAFLLLPNVLGLRMTPPRGDSWAGCVGIVGGLWVYFQRNGLSGITWASLASGISGGIGFSAAALFKLMGIRTGWETNWHSVLEQSYGLINGLGIGAVMWVLSRRAPKVTEDPPVRRWTDIFAVLGLLSLIEWLNLRQNSEEWVKSKAVPEYLYWLSTATWYNIAWAAFTLMLLAVLLANRRRAVAAAPSTWLGRAQWLYLAFLWIIVIGNFEKALVGFREQRLITEGVIFLNATLCTFLALTWPRTDDARESREQLDYGRFLRRTGVQGVAASGLFVILCWGLVRAVWGNTFAGYSGKHIRFGPNATAYERPKAGQPHP